MPLKSFGGEIPESVLSCSVVWSDPDLLEVQVEVFFGGWAGAERGYVTREELRSFANQLESVHAGGKAALLEAGQQDLSWVRLEIFEYGLARRVGMRVHLGRASGADSRTPREPRELRISVPIERGQLSAFARSLQRVVQIEAGTAKLMLPTDWPH